MIDKNILFIGPYATKPKGGVAFVLYEYKKLYPDSYFVTSTITKNSITKVYGFAFGILKLLYFLLTKNYIKIVHIHSASYSSFRRKYIFYQVCSFFQKKIIFHLHGGAFQEFYETANNQIASKIEGILNNVSCVVCLSNNWKVYYQKQFSPKKIEIIPNIIDFNEKENLRATKTNDTLVFLFLGLIDSNKGIWLLLDTLREHRNELIGKAIFNIGGNGETQKLQRLIKEYELEGVVIFIGWVSGEQKSKRLQEADVYLLPSYNEGLPISILEAMSYSLPIISTYVGGIPEVVSSENGILISPGNKEELRAAINYFIELNREERYSLGQNSHIKVRPYLPAEVNKKLNNLYTTLLTEHSQYI
ncbi:glycosyltransferase family 4 protein [Arenibacter sp. ARW7G5Y1]|uniref:glycosyltransferase family 4 protein n=1 Tax=Arenibacter sp. ARW7G5Y1 TaxID=2135619 RepID=UPI000D76550D|nr:glycosyltransferase family 4 protein [Arenibacter sp. ARW7G5Y1]PXX25039.1 glycosyltransferase involved in cell wall biosynthesis [Arenibacter sp. ARW7G5Y1]